MTRIRSLTIAAALALLAAAPAHATITAAPGWLARSIPTPDTVVGGVVRVGNAIVVGLGSFGPGTQRVVRLDGTVATTIANGFGSLGGMDVDDTGTLWLVDNCFTGDFGCSGATTGDTIYTVGTPLTRTTAQAAIGSEVLPAGSIPFAADVLFANASIYVSDGAGPGAGRVLRLVGGTPSTVISGLDYVAGLATAGGELLVGNVNGSFVGSIGRYSATGTSLGTLVTGLSGQYGLAAIGAPAALSTGGFSSVDGTSNLVAVDGAGTATERARGWSFSGDVFYDAPRDTALVLGFGETAIAAICADANGDELCDAECAAPVALAKARANFGKQATPPGDDTFKLRGEMTLPAPFAPALDPLTNGIHVWVDDANGRQVVDVVVPGGAYDPPTKRGWTVNAAHTRWRWRSRGLPGGPAVNGLRQVNLSTNARFPGLVKLDVAGQKGGYGAAGAAFPLRLAVALSPSQCAQVVPAFCGANTSGNTVACK